MSRYTYLRSVMYVLLGAAFALAGCGQSSQQSPPKQEVRDAVAAALPPFLSLDSIELEPISTGSESVKVNFKAIVVPKDDLFQVDREVDGTPRVILLKMVQASGTKDSLYGSLEAHHMMDKWTLDSPEIQIGLTQLGTPRGSFPPQSYVTGSDEANAALRQQKTNAENQLLEKKAALDRQNREILAQEEQKQALREQQEKNRLAQETAQKEAAAQRKIEEQKQTALNHVESLEKEATADAQYYQWRVATYGTDSRFQSLNEEAHAKAINSKKVAEEARNQYNNTWGVK